MEQSPLPREEARVANRLWNAKAVTVEGDELRFNLRCQQQVPRGPLTTGLVRAIVRLAYERVEALDHAFTLVASLGEADEIIADAFARWCDKGRVRLNPDASLDTAVKMHPSEGILLLDAQANVDAHREAVLLLRRHEGVVEHVLVIIDDMDSTEEVKMFGCALHRVFVGEALLHHYHRQGYISTTRYERIKTQRAERRSARP